MNLYTLRAALLLPTFMLASLVFAQGSSTCTVSNMNDDGDEVAVWLMSGPYADTYVFDGDGTFTQNEDGTAQMTGTVVGAASGDMLTLSVNFENGSSWSEWSAMGRGYKDEPGVVGDNYLDYTYYEMSSTSTMTVNGGEDVLSLTHAPANFYYGFQVGVGANATTATAGLGGWFTYTSTDGSGQGDILMDGDCTPEPVDVDGCTDADACNYNPAATIDDGSCLLAMGCDVCDGAGGVTDNPEVGDACDDGDDNTENDVYTSCDVCAGTPIGVDVEGCMDDMACNYNPAATIDDGSCLLALGCDECDDAGGVTDNPEIGDACDDGDANTENDVYTSCDVCEGTTIAGGDCPDNNSCATAMAIGEGTFTADTICEGGISNICFATGGSGAVWYAYTPSMSGIATVSSSVDLDTPDTRLSVHTGACDAPVCLASDDDGGEGFTSIATFDATAGETYLLEWDNRWDSGEFTFEVSVGAATPGCTDATACNYNDAATSDDDSCIYADGCDTCSGETDGTGTVVAGPAVGDACDDGNDNTINDMILEDCSCLGEFIVDPCPNANSSCATAMAIGEGTFTADTICGSGISNVCFATGGDAAVWYAYTPSMSGIATVSSSVDLDTPDTRLSVHTGACDAPVCLASDDDGGEGFTSIATFDATAGETYLIEWDNRWNSGAFTFEVSVGAATPGCTDAAACNYNDAATSDDDSCIYADGCDTCSGETDGTGTVVAGPAVGDACDDGDDNTIDDMILADCSCEGTPLVDPCTNANSSCATAMAIGEGTFTADTICGSGISNVCFATGGDAAVWYAYTPSMSGIATVSSSVDLDTPDTRLSVHTGACDAPVCLASDDDGGEGFTSIATFDATAGETYLIEWDNRWNSGAFTFEVSVGAATPGCTDATACNYNDAATSDDDSCIYADGCDTCSGETDGTGTVVAGPAVGDACDDGDDNTIDDMVMADCSCEGTPLVDPCPNANSSCANAMAIGEGVFTADTVCGTGIANICFATGGTSAVWYEYTASTSGLATVSSNDDLDLPDTRVSVYTGGCAALECLASDDDGGDGFTSIASFSTTAGETYLIEWDNRWDSGEFTFEVSVEAGGDNDGDGIDNTVDNCVDTANEDQADLDGDGAGDVCDDDIDGDGDLNGDDCDPLDGAVFLGAACDDGDETTVGDAIQADCSCMGGPAPENTSCGGAIAVSEGTYTSTGITEGTLGASNVCFGTGGADAVWYAYTASASGEATVSSSIDLDEPDTRLSVYTGGCDAPTCLASDDDSGEGFTSVAVFAVTAGETYLIEWDDRWDDGSFDFEISLAGPGIAPLVEEGVGLSLNAYPNPSNGVSMTLDIANLPGEGEVVNVALVDVFGRTVNIDQFANDRNETTRLVEFENELENGVYHVRVDYNGIVKTVMIVVNK